MKLRFTVIILIFSVSLCAQEKSKAKFGNVTAQDFQNKRVGTDSSASAIVLADIGSTTIEGNRKGWFSLVFKRYRRVQILDKNAYNLANISIGLYADGESEEELNRVRAVTYNLENGKIVESTLDTKTGIFKDKLNKNLVVRKFTLPNIREGSIIEYEYTITSDFLTNLQPWDFQGKHPVLWSEYNLTLPSFFNYVFLSQGYLKYDINERKEGRASYTILTQSAGPSERYNLDATTTDFRWVIKNVPAMKEESFTSNIRNYISRIEFQLSEFRDPLVYRRIMNTWPEFSELLLARESFGLPISRENGWMKEIVDPLEKKSGGKLELAKRIFASVRDNITCTDHSAHDLDQPLRNILKSGKGTVAEINLLLTAILRYAGLQADPVLLSTRSHGFIHQLYPLQTRFNYVICKAVIDGKTWLLDASEPHLGFGFLPLECYNGDARVIDKQGTAVILLADSLMEKKFTSVFMINDEKGKLVGSVQQTPGYYESLDLRDRIKEKGIEQLQKDIRQDFGMDILISNFGIDSLEKYDNELSLHYDFDIKDDAEDIFYFNPLFGEGYKDNPFKSVERIYPVEMSFAMDETYVLQMEVPAGFVVDELPQSLMVKLNERDEGLFEYRVYQSGESISFRSRIRIQRANFEPDEYEALREFFNIIVKKQAEQIVFKKKK